MMQLAFVIKALGWILPVLWPSTYAFILTFCFYSVASSMIHTSVCMHETLNAINKNEDFKKLQHKQSAFSQYFCMIALPIGGLMYEINKDIPLILNSIACLVALFAATKYTEAPRQKEEKRNPLEQLKRFWDLLKSNPALSWFCIFTGFWAAVIGNLIFIFQSYYMSIGETMALFSISLVWIYLLRGLGAYYSHYIYKFIDGVTALKISMVLTAFSIVLSVAFSSITMFFIGFSIAMTIRGLQEPMAETLLQEMSHPTKRGTINGGVNIIRRISNITLNLGTGSLIVAIGAQNSLIIIGIVISFIGCMLLYMHSSCKSMSKAY